MDTIKAIAITLAPGIVAYGTIMQATGYRYNFIWDWQAVIAAVVAMGLVAIPSPFTVPNTITYHIPDSKESK